MALKVTPLSDSALKAAKPKDKPYKLADGEGLYLEIMPTGSKLWRLKYRHLGKENRLAFGSYPEVTLVQARHHIPLAYFTFLLRFSTLRLRFSSPRS